MKKFMYLLPLFMYLASCNYHKDAEPAQRYLSQQFKIQLLYADSDAFHSQNFTSADQMKAHIQLKDTLAIVIDTVYQKGISLPGEATVAVYDSIYKIAMTWPQAWRANKGATNVWFVTLLILAGICVIGLAWSASRGESNGKGFLLWLIPIFSCLVIAFSIVDWFHTYEKEIKKIDYVHRMATDGNLENWWPLPAEKY